MTKDEVIDLLKVIKRSFPHFDTSAESVQHHFKYLQDFPFGAALDNIESHIRTERYPPLIAEIRGRVGDLMDSQRSKAEAEAHYAQLDLWRRTSAPPPAGYWDHIRAIIRGEDTAREGEQS